LHAKLAPNLSSNEPPVARRESIMQMVVTRIETLVRNGDLGAGSRLPPEQKLAAMLQVSRASLREALKGMMFLGLIKSRAGDGTYLQPFLSDMVSHHFRWMLLLREIKYLELYELRQIMEPAAAALAARRHTEDDMNRMRQALSEMKASLRDPDRFVQSDMDLHNSITRASENTAIETTMRMMYDALYEGRYRIMPLIKDIKETYERHERIVSLIEKRDSANARRAVVEDLKCAEALLRKDMLMQERLRDKGELAGKARLRRSARVASDVPLPK
jgi:GntR family transcriptional repressor for pyruvate dehydrogenase complex